MPAASTVPSAKAALKALLEAHSWPAPAPEIRWGGPTESEDLPQGGTLVYFGDTTITDDNYRLGAASWDENYTLRIVLEVRWDGDDEQATELQAWGLYGEVLKVLAANRTLSGTISYLDGEEAREVRQQNIPLPQQWLSRIVVDQPCVAVVTAP